MINIPNLHLLMPFCNSLSRAVIIGQEASSQGTHSIHVGTAILQSKHSAHDSICILVQEHFLASVVLIQASISCCLPENDFLLHALLLFYIQQDFWSDFKIYVCV